jgi:hypothetical protein
MRTRIAFAVIVLLSLLSMAPDEPPKPLFLPLVFKSCPVPTLSSLTSDPAMGLNAFTMSHNWGTINFNTETRLDYAMTYNDDTGEELGNYVYSYVNYAIIQFFVPCDLIGTPLHVRFDLGFDESCTSSLYGEVIPTYNWYFTWECPPCVVNDPRPGCPIH